MNVRAVLTDIEGTTTPISFVAETLFPHAAARLADYVHAHAAEPEIAAALKETAELEGRALTTGQAIEVLLGWIAADRKATPLKTLQGKIWREAYESGTIRSPVYPDAVAALRAWKARGLRLDVYSSGSVEAQVLLYQYSEAGDLTPLFDAYFDTRTGPKMEAASYARIAAEIGHAPADILFLSDLPRENEAARAAGLQTIRIDRALPPNTALIDAAGLNVASDFAVVEKLIA